MVAFLPVPGGHIKLAERFVDRAFSFTMGWNYWYNWVMVLPAELSAASVLIDFWDSVGVPKLLSYRRMRSNYFSDERMNLEYEFKLFVDCNYFHCRSHYQPHGRGNIWRMRIHFLQYQGFNHHRTNRKCSCLLVEFLDSNSTLDSRYSA